MRAAMNNRALRARRGFTYVELLIVVAIIAALAVVGLFSAANIKQNMDQAKLDRIAENLYSAAQNQLTLHAAQGDQINALLTAQDGTGKVSPLPSDLVAGTEYFAPTGSHPLHYITSENTALAELLFPTGTISEEIRGGYWIVEFEPDSHTVYSVFYSESVDPGSYDLNALRPSPDARKNVTKARVGYFSGLLGDPITGNVGELACKVEIVNEEELTAYITVSLPDWGVQTYTGEQLSYTLTLTGLTSGKVWKPEAKTKPIIGSRMADGKIELDLDPVVLDSLKPGKSFFEQFGGPGFIPGEDVMLEVNVSCESDKLLLYPASAQATANSLFANGSLADGKTVYAGWGRHLQNLNTESGGFAPADAVGVYQTQNIGFGEHSQWYGVYRMKDGEKETARPFTPIKNGKVSTFCGNGREISALRVSAEGDAGLFAAFDGGEISGVRLMGAVISGKGAVGGLAGVASRDLTITDCTASGCVVADGADAGGFVGAASGALTVGGCALTAPTAGGASISGSGSAGGFAGSVSGVLAVKDSKVSYARVSGGTVGGAAGSTAGSAGFEKIEIADTVVTGSGAVGGLAGSVAGDAAVSGCALRMNNLASGVPNARQAHWLESSGGAAGGLIGAAASARIENSFAATVVRGRTCAGGLAGRVNGTLTVGGSYANCYLHAPAIGGLAGYCGGGSFTSCYSAGFAMEGDGIATAAGFVPSAASVTDCYTIFCFDDATLAAGEGIPTPAPESMKRFAFAAEGAVKNAFYTYSAVEKTKAKLLTSAELEKTKIAGLKSGWQSPVLYNLTAKGITPGGNYPYPTLDGLRHYNDFLVLESNPVELKRLSVRGWGDNPVTEADADPFARTRMSGERVAVPLAPSRTLQKEIFVGWFYEKDLPQKDGLVDWCAKVDGLAINGSRFVGVPADELRALTESEEDGTLYVDVKDNDWKEKEDRVLYAVYREVKSFDVVVQFMSFNADNWLGEDNNAVTPEKYMGRGTFAIRQNIVYTVDPIVFAAENRNYKEETYSFDLLQELESTNGYTVVDQFYDLSARYKGKTLATNIQPAACFDKDLRVIDAAAENAYAADKDGTYKKLTVKLDRQRTYVVLCDAELIKVPVQFVFKNSEASGEILNDFEIEKHPDLEARFAALETELGKVAYSKEKTDTYTATVWMLFPPNAIVWSELPEFEGFELLRDEIQNFAITKDSATGENGKFPNAPIIPYARAPYILAFNLNGGVCEVDLPGDKTESRSALDSVTDMHYMQSVKDGLPAVGKLSRPGYQFAGWKFYALETYGSEDASQLGELKVKDGSYSGDYLMPHDNVMAVAQWVEAMNPPVRVEIYVQDVSNDRNAVKNGTATYSFYNAYTVAPEDLTQEGASNIFTKYKDLIKSKDSETAANDLLKTAYSDMQGNDGENVRSAVADADRKKYSTSPAVTISSTDVREYLRDAYDGTIDGAIHNHQLRYNPAKSTMLDEENKTQFNYAIDATGTAVFKLYYDREIITFEFILPEVTEERLPKEHSDPGEYGGYALYPVWRNYGEYWYGENPVCVLGNEYIDSFVSNFDEEITKVVGTREIDGKQYVVPRGEFFNKFSRKGVPVVTIDGQDYVFARDFICAYFYYDWLGNLHYDTFVCFVPFYDSGDLAGAGDDYKWARAADGAAADGLYKIDKRTYQGLYEAEFQDWPRGNYQWTVYNPKTGQTYASMLSYLGSYYYVSWITGEDGGNDYKEESTKSHALAFSASYSTGTNEVKFYLEDPKKSGLDSKLREYIKENPTASKKSIDEAVNGWVENGKTGLFAEKPEYVFNTDANGFTLNDKFTGRTVKGYVRDYSEEVDIFGRHWKEDGTFHPISDPSEQGTVQFMKKLDIYNLRNWYYVYFENIKNAPQEAYFYGATLDRLPNVSANLASYRPANIGNEYVFQGWYTENGGGGTRLAVCEKNEKGDYQEVTGSGAWLTGTLCECTTDEKGETVYKLWNGRMPAANLKLFAYWATKNVRVDFYSRLPVALGTTPGEETPYTYHDAHLFEPIPAEVFRKVENGWGMTDNKYTTEDGQQHAFSGWFRYDGEGAPGHDEILLSRFHEKEFVTASDHLTLAAQWKQVAGEAYYDIVCYLLDGNGKTKTDDQGNPLTVRIKGSAENGQKARVGEPLTVQAPSTADHPKLAMYYPTSPLVSIKKFEKGTDIEFFYREAEVWSYLVQSNVTYQDLGGGRPQEILMREDERKTAALNVIVYPEQIKGYILNADSKQKQIMKSDEDKTAKFGYTLDLGSIWQPFSLDWVMGGSAPELLRIENGTKNQLACETPGYAIRTWYSVDGGAKAESLPALRQGIHSVVITIELWSTGDGESPVLTIYRGETSVHVYSTVTVEGVDGTLYYDGAGFYTKGGENASGYERTELIAKLREDHPGETFLGFWRKDAGEGEGAVINADGVLVGELESGAGLVPKFDSTTPRE